jgi:peptide/nickel transport system permease protein
MEILFNNKREIFGLFVLCIFLFLGILAPFLSPYNPYYQNLTEAYLPPFWINGGSLAHLLGTDSLGRDILSRMLYGFRIASYVAIASSITAAAVGVPIGLISGYYRGIIDAFFSRLVDAWMSIPPVVLSIALILIIGVAINNVILAIVLVDWTRFARVIRGEVLEIREKDYVLIARVLGYNGMRIIRKEILPNVVPLIIALLTIEMSIAITVEALLSFVGLGVPAGTPSWGAMIAEGLPYLQVDPWPTLLPLLVMVITILGINMFGDGLSDSIDPILRLEKVKKPIVR